MSTASWKAILTAVARGEGKTLREWSDDCEAQAAALVAAIPAYMRKHPMLCRCPSCHPLAMEAS